ncbi:hypothetical protein EAW55_00590 [Legionella jordanis]|nr:hypothetical protein EAW55_00590 [Legionella jordanis]RMX20953.1 hypothetical protein EAS68_06450 [Legionella jordanis]
MLKPNPSISGRRSMIKRIISGGQTGVDQAALKTAKDMAFAIAGFCPKGGLDENQVNSLISFPELTEAASTAPEDRTKRNIEASDGSLIVVPSWPLPQNSKDGTQFMIDYCQRQKKPFIIISLNHKGGSVEKIKAWINANRIRSLNIGGPRESSSPGIYEQSCELFKELFTQLKSAK